MTKSTKRIKPKKPGMMYIQGTGFAMTARILGALPYNPKTLVPLRLASTVNSAFACELFLKCLLYIEHGSFLATHRLDILFRELQDKTQKEIEDRWNAQSEVRNPVLDEFDKLIGKHITPRNFIDTITQAGSAFVDWRYANELDGSAGFFLSGLPEILERMVHEREPTWGVRIPEEIPDHPQG